MEDSNKKEDQSTKELISGLIGWVVIILIGMFVYKGCDKSDTTGESSVSVDKKVEYSDAETKVDVKMVELVRMLEEYVDFIGGGQYNYDWQEFNEARINAYNKMAMKCDELKYRPVSRSSIIDDYIDLANSVAQSEKESLTSNINSCMIQKQTISTLSRDRFLGQIKVFKERYHKELQNGQLHRYE